MGDLPSGAVTFLFTDIEGSTQLVKQLRDRYAQVLAEHQRLLRTAFAAHNGHEVDTQGDSFFVAFASARDALTAAVEGQLALLAHPWPEGVQINVRMGLHTGQASVSDGRYTGLAVHRAARIGAAGHGGQVIVSQATQTLLEDEEEDLHIFLRDLGEQRLKDLDRPVRLYQAGTDGLPSNFPPLRHEAPLAPAAPVPAAAGWRRTPILVGAALVLAAAVAAAVFVATRDSAGGLGAISANHVGVIDPGTNEVVTEIPAGIRPGPITVGGGSVWVGNLQDRTLTRIDARRRVNAGTIALDNRTPTAIAYGAGAVWIAHGARGQVSRVDPQFGEATTIDVTRGPPIAQGSGVAVGEDAVWAVFGDSTLARIDAGDSKVTGSTLTGGEPTGTVVGEGAVWVANSGDASVSRYNPTTFEQGAIRTLSVGREPAAIAFGAGAVWVACAADDVVTRIDPDTGAATTIAVGDRPVALAIGAGAVWVANGGGRSVSRIDPETRDVIATIDIGNAPTGIAVGQNEVWVSAEAP